MYVQELLAVICYFAILLAIGFFSYRKHLSAADFIIGGRSMNYWLTAFAAHASDMSSWLFMGYPAVIYATGVFNAWTALGLIFFFFLNWQFVAPKIRVATEQYNSMTFSSFFESRLGDTSGTIRVFTAIMSLVFYTIYISAGLVGLGLLLDTLFGLEYFWGILIGIVIVVPYVFTGGYVTLAWIDLFQGFFLLGAIIFVPLFLLGKVGGFDGISQAIEMKKLTMSLFPDFSAKTFFSIIGMAAGWGLGYFGQPHIVTKFMGIRNVTEIAKSKYIGMTWMVLSMGAATFVGIVGIAFFPQGLADPSLVFIYMVKESFAPFFVGFILCAVLAATINAMSSQVLVLTSNITEDFYKRIFRKNASSKELLLVARGGVVVVALLAFIIAIAKISSIFSLVLYAFTGLGASFGPLLLLCLYWKGINKYGAWAGILSGGLIAALWHYVNVHLPWDVPAMLPAFFSSFILIIIVSLLTQSQKEAVSE
ncbi:MAG: sodium/proline symporter [Candidatus Melainabacteria bacterium]|nr:sodium/proline symporter [Candidatus Melainabacteria bacterium]